MTANLVRKGFWWAETFTNSNITSTIVPVKGIVPGDQTRIPWAKVPLIESGLFGPVSLKTFESVPF